MEPITDFNEMVQYIELTRKDLYHTQELKSQFALERNIAPVHKYNIKYAWRVHSFFDLNDQLDVLDSLFEIRGHLIHQNELTLKNRDQVGFWATVQFDSDDEAQLTRLAVYITDANGKCMLDFADDRRFDILE